MKDNDIKGLFAAVQGPQPGADFEDKIIANALAKKFAVPVAKPS